MPRPRLVGIVNITADSFSDGGRFLDPAAAIEHGRRLAADGADIVGLGAAASNVAANPVAALEAAGIARERLILDPGMGFFLSSRPEASLHVLAGLGRLKQEFGLPIMVSVSRKSFLAAITGRGRPDERGAATLAAELYAA